MKAERFVEMLKIYVPTPNMVVLRPCNQGGQIPSLTFIDEDQLETWLRVTVNQAIDRVVQAAEWGDTEDIAEHKRFLEEVVVGYDKDLLLATGKIVIYWPHFEI